MIKNLILIGTLALPGCFEPVPPREQKRPHELKQIQETQEDKQEPNSPSGTSIERGVREQIQFKFKAEKPDPKAPPPPLRAGQMFS